MFIRKSSRGVLINSQNKILLFKFMFPEIQSKKVLWVPPGGGVKKDENFKQALKRELFEETGLVLNLIGPWVWTKKVVFNGRKGDFISYERYYLIKMDNLYISFENMTLNEARTLKGYKWWSVDVIVSSNEEFFTPQIGNLFLEIITGNIPNSPINIH